MAVEMLTRPKPGQFTVLEAVNTGRREVYVFMTPRPIYAEMARMAARPPEAVAHWLVDVEHVDFRSLEFGLSEEAARSYIEDQLSRPLGAGWRYVFDPPDALAPLPPRAALAA